MAACYGLNPQLTLRASVVQLLLALGAHASAIQTRATSLAIFMNGLSAATIDSVRKVPARIQMVRAISDLICRAPTVLPVWACNTILLPA